MDATLAPNQAIPTGKPDDRSRDKWLLLALIGLGDIDAARYLWEMHVPRTLRGLPSGQDGWRWDGQRQLYLSRTGRAVGGQELKGIASGFSLSVENDLRAEASDMAVGITPIDQWQRATADTVKDLNIAEAAVAVGGFDKLQPYIERIQGTPDKPPGIAFSLDKLAGFAEDVANHADRADTEAAIVLRAGLYANASQTTFEDTKRESHKDAVDEAGRRVYLYERNILGPAEQHCKPGGFTDGCGELTRAGWVPIGSMSLPGQRTCAMNCKCSMEFSLIGPALGTN